MTIICCKGGAASLCYYFVLLLSLSFIIDKSSAARNNFFKPPRSNNKQIDPYKVLGVKRNASNDDIQKAYRQKARETHRKCNAILCIYNIVHMMCISLFTYTAFLTPPSTILTYIHSADKNPSPNANEQFREVTDAFDILGNPTSKKRYDNKVRLDEQQRQRAEYNRRRQNEMKKQQLDKERMEQQRIHVTMMNKSREAQHRMIKISTYQEFEIKGLDTNNKKEEDI